MGMVIIDEKTGEVSEEECVIMKYVDPYGNVTVTDSPALMREVQAPERRRRENAFIWKLNLLVFLNCTVLVTMFIDLFLCRVVLGLVLSPIEALKLYAFVFIVLLTMAVPVWLWK